MVTMIMIQILIQDKVKTFQMSFLCKLKCQVPRCSTKLQNTETMKNCEDHFKPLNGVISLK